MTGALYALAEWARERSRRLVERVRCAWAVILAAYRVAVLRRIIASPACDVYKVVALNEETGDDANVTAWFDPEEWEESVRVATRWGTDRFRVDVRYVAHGKKYRLVLRPGDSYALSDAPERHRGGPKGVMAAELVGDEATVDITRRILKYQGPMKDFHRGMGLRVAVTDLFPFDDPAELKVNFLALRVVDARAHVVHIPVACDDLAVALGLGTPPTPPREMETDTDKTD